MRYLIVFVASALVFVASAIEVPKQQKPASPPPAEAPAEQPPEKPAEAPAPAPDKIPTVPTSEQPAAETEDEETLPPLPADGPPAGPPPTRFTPTEKVRADFPVSFPIDI